MVDLFTEEIYKNVVEGNMELYKQFFSCDPNEEGTIEYWKNAIGLYNRLDDEGKQVLLSIIKSKRICNLTLLYGHMAPRILLRHSILEYDWKRLTSMPRDSGVWA